MFKTEVLDQPASPPPPPTPGAPKAPKPGPPEGELAVVSGLPVPPRPPPAWPAAPCSGIEVVLSVTTPLLEVPDRSIRPSICTAPEAVTTKGFGPWTFSTAPLSTPRSWTPTWPPVTGWPLTSAKLVSKTTTVPAGMIQSWSPPRAAWRPASGRPRSARRVAWGSWMLARASAPARARNTWDMRGPPGWIGSDRGRIVKVREQRACQAASRSGSPAGQACRRSIALRGERSYTPQEARARSRVAPAGVDPSSFPWPHLPDPCPRTKSSGASG